MNWMLLVLLAALATPVHGAPLAIDPDKTVCYPFKGLQRAGWRLVGEHDRGKVARLVGARKARFMEAQTLRCKTIDDGKITEFYLQQQWWKWGKVS